MKEVGSQLMFYGVGSSNDVNAMTASVCLEVKKTTTGLINVRTQKKN